MFGEDDTDGLAADRVHDAATHHLLRCEPYRPSSAPFGRRSADHRNDGGELHAVEQTRLLRSRVVAKSMLKAASQIALADAQRFAFVPTNRRCGRGS